MSSYSWDSKTSGTRLAHFIPRGPVTNADKYLGREEASHVNYHKRLPIIEQPIIPFLAIGFHFETDIMVALANDPTWGMLEVDKLTFPDGRSFWFTLDSQVDGTQYLGISDNTIGREAAAQFPMTIYSTSVMVEERNMGKKTYFHVAYTRVDGAPIEFEMTVKNKSCPPLFRNINAMNHSERKALILLDLESICFAGKHFRFLGDSDRCPQRVLGVKMATLISQSAGGLVARQWQQEQLCINTKEYRHQYTLTKTERGARLTSDFKVPEVHYNFDTNGDGLELRSIEIFKLYPDHIREVASFHFNPSLPDLRYGAPTSAVQSRMTATINGRSGYQKGVVSVSAGVQPGSVRLNVDSLAPVWARRRPLESHLYLSEKGVLGFAQIK